MNIHRIFLGARDGFRVPGGLQILIVLLLCLGGCSSSDDTAFLPAAAGVQPGEAAPPVACMEDALATQGLKLIATAAGRGQTGYLAEDSNRKRTVVLQGSSYDMGYQMGALMPEGVWLMSKVYPFRLVEDMLGISVDDLPQVLVDFVIGEIMSLCTGALNVIPDYLEEEMQGMADGATDQGYDVSFEDVLLVNEGFDAIYSIFFTGVIPSMSGLADLLEGLRGQFPALDDYIRIEGPRVIFPRGDPGLLGCNEFVVSGAATAGKNIYHGRDFMFPTGDIIQDIACLGVYLPDDPGSHPFVAVTAPGFVGQTTALNAEGLSMGMDVVRAACTRSDPGMGCLLVLRDVVQHCSDLDSAIERMQAMDRGVSWLFILGDDEYSHEFTHGVVVEAGMSAPAFNGPDLMPAWQQLLLSLYIALLEDTQLPIPSGMMLRSQEWVSPTAMMGLGLKIPGEDLHIGIHFPDQIETWDDAVIATNNYLIPRMVFTEYTPWMQITGTPAYVERAMERYRWLFERMATEYGDIDFATARNLIDFLNPNSDYGDTEYYEQGGQIEGHHAIMDNNNLVLEALFGHYGPDKDKKTPWARIELQPFIAAANQ